MLAPSVTRDSSTTKWLHPCIGIYRIQGYLEKHGHRVTCFDPALHKATGKGQSLEEIMAGEDWDIIGFSVLEESLAEDIANMHLAAKISPKSTLVAGGIEAQYNYQQILDKSPCRIAVLGEGEIPLLEIANGTPFHEIPGVVFRNNARPLTQEEIWEATEAVRYEDMPYEEYWDHYVAMYGDDLSDEILDTIHTVRIFTRNYCPVGCKFCVSTNQLSDAAGVKKVRVVDIIDDNLVALVKRVLEAKPRTRTIYFTDDDFCLNLDKVKDFCRALIAEGVKTKFICFSRADRLDEEAIGLMAAAGFRVINMGLESFSMDILKEYTNKYRNSFDRVGRNLELLRAHGIMPFVSVILCSPEGTIEDVEMTVQELIAHIDRGGFEAGVNVSVQPFKGSYYFEQYCDFESEIVRIPGTRYTLRRDYFIRAQDKEVRELQFRFLERYPEAIKRAVQSSNIMHATSSAQARLKLEIIGDLIEEIKMERSDVELLLKKQQALDSLTRGVEAIHRLEDYKSGSAV